MRARLFFRGENIIRNQILVSKRWYIGQIYTMPEYQKENWKKNLQFPLEQEKSNLQYSELNFPFGGAE